LLNVLLPGAGQCYLGQKRLGGWLLVGFLLPFFAALAVFLLALDRYFALVASGNILEGNQLESLGAAFHVPWLILLTALAVTDFLMSMILLWLRPPPV
jgi:hypothetical protein